jgi:hypothetical protein
MATLTYTTINDLLEAVLSVQSVLGLYNEGQLKILIIDLEEIEVRNDCADEASSNLSNRPTKTN